MKLSVIKNDLPCTNCIATKQMRESSNCTKTIVQYDGQYIPGCMVNLIDLSQADRNFLTCQTYNLGIYSACKTCPLDCEKNTKPKSPISEIVGLFSGLLGMDDAKKKEVDKAFGKLNQPEFKDVYSSLERASKSIKNVMGGQLGSSDIARKVLEVESRNLKQSFGDLVKDGKITENEANVFNTQINSDQNIQKLKSVLEVMKQQVEKKPI